MSRYLKELRPKHSTFESGNALFISRNGKRLNKNKVTELVGKYIRRSGVRDRGSCHLFRHATATNMLRGGANIRHVQEMLGHQHITSTQIYTHVTVDELSETYMKTHPAAKNTENE